MFSLFFALNGTTWSEFAPTGAKPQIFEQSKRLWPEVECERRIGQSTCAARAGGQRRDPHALLLTGVFEGRLTGAMLFPSMTCLISVVISYSSNEKAFIQPVLSESLRFSNDVVVSFGSHLLDGTVEDKPHIENLKSLYSTVSFVEYDVDLSIDLSQQPGVVARPTAYWHNLARWTGVQSLRCKQWVFIIDTDEIPDGRLVRKWSRAVVPHLNVTDCLKISAFWYFKKPIYQATTHEDTAVLIHYTHLTQGNIFGDWERLHLVAASGCTFHGQIKDFDGSVLWHHFSWVRTRAGLQHKLKHWAHADDMFHNVNATELVGKIFENDYVNDFVHHYDYVVVDNTFDIQV